MTPDPPRYVIRTVADFLNVPEDRRGACLAEFPRFMGYAAAMSALLGTKPTSLDYIWIDDGEAKIRGARITTADGKELLRMNIRYVDDPPAQDEQDLATGREVNP